ncbi:NAD(P)/FAD-dependent oxidoreductase [Candidatus Phycosocius spiralis]|uniref:NAD/FAD-binding protein n=1 Tax=Candidatus Phycosocius spiralis TaxID=2815099 RepID=A0ABQ4PS70_9PROT|nr:FAD-dependent oxidoreductase [Candidatus Phycosocius spiralis]GIU65869.1 NAD/FAD-binding protein [Candidatus Phycosocius spiralis]
MKLAVIGTGISGLSAAWALRDVHEVTVFEKADRLGGHSNTVTVDYEGTSIPVDTGFIVYNALNYPNLIALFEALQVQTKPSDMSFSVRDGQPGSEWGSDGVPGFFAWKRNIFAWSHWALLGEMIQFNAKAQKDADNPLLNELTLGSYCAKLGLSTHFLERYLVPMGAAIWSTPEQGMLDYPAASFIKFFNNHRLVHFERPNWRTVTGGSQSYVQAIGKELGARVKLQCSVTAIRRTENGVEIEAEGTTQKFDQVILACHSDEALALLSDPTEAETAILGAIRYAPNVAVLHRDPSFMPQRKAAWASWNVARGNRKAPIELTYWMNRLQGIDPNFPLFVTLNPAREVNSDLVFATIPYAHPQFDHQAARAQKGLAYIQGVQKTWFAGAWQGYGFHEDGLRAGLRVALKLGGKVPWNFIDDDIVRDEVSPMTGPALGVLAPELGLVS